MKGIIISESLVIRKGVIGILSDEKVIESMDEGHVYADVKNGDYDLVIFDLNKNTKRYLEGIKELKESGKSSVMVLDFYEDARMFSKCMKIGVDSYILANIEGESISYAVGLLSRGKKYFFKTFLLVCSWK